MAREDSVFSFRYNAEKKEKLRQRAKLNGRSLNAELTYIVDQYLDTPTPIIGYRSDAERAANEQAEELKKSVVEMLIKLYGENKKPT
ncbi:MULTISPECIES: Arc family DNA-binding protein [Providencia]|uniref:Arc family DNA-binding protein n=1 Tax=Providencia TaxID=586 RepID=UPI0013740031|nr:MULTISPECIES: Arc family DNA-binding protein [Providencia]BBU96490.1 hypothetical protein BML2496_23730 [Providencia rettgeri]